MLIESRRETTLPLNTVSPRPFPMNISEMLPCFTNNSGAHRGFPHAPGVCVIHDGLWWVKQKGSLRSVWDSPVPTSPSVVCYPFSTMHWMLGQYMIGGGWVKQKGSPRSTLGFPCPALCCISSFLIHTLVAWVIYDRWWVGQTERLSAFSVGFPLSPPPPLLYVILSHPCTGCLRDTWTVVDGSIRKALCVQRWVSSVPLPLCCMFSFLINALDAWVIHGRWLMGQRGRFQPLLTSPEIYRGSSHRCIGVYPVTLCFPHPEDVPILFSWIHVIQMDNAVGH